MEEFYPFFLIMFAGVFFSMVFRRMHFPWVVGLIIGGIIIGPHFFNILKITPTAEFLGQIGLVFLMFMAGLETNLSDFKESHKGLFWLAFINGAIPFVVGVAIAFAFGYGWVSALLVGTIFISSSIAIVIPSLERRGLLHSRIGQSFVVSIVLQDIASLVMLSFVLQSVSPITKLPLYLFYPLVVVALLILKLIIPKIVYISTLLVKDGKDMFQQEFRAVFLILIGTVISFELLGLHPIIAGFFTGLILSGPMKNELLREKIRTISYGVFIPTFFVIVGAQTDVGVLINSNGALILTIAIVFGSMASKFFSGWLGGKLAGFSSNESFLFGSASIPQLSTTLAVAYASLTLGYIDQKLITAMIALSIITVIASPILMNLFIKKINEPLVTASSEPDS